MEKAVLILKTRKLLSALLLGALLLSVPAAAAEEPDTPEPPAVSAQAAILMEADSGRVLYEKNADEPRLIASTTKILTALLVLERGDIDRVVTIDPAWAGIEGSTMYLRSGQELTVRDLLYGLLLASGNDAATALACLTAGSEEAFARQMNRRAAELGCENAHFENPSGLDGEEHHASARDLAIITREAIRRPDFCEIVSTPVKTVGELTYTNHNRLLRECPGVFGVKTGYTEAAGRTLVTCCAREGVTLICVTLTDPDDWDDHRSLYDWGFQNCRRETLLTGEETWEIPVIGGETETVEVMPAGALSAVLLREDSGEMDLCLPRFVFPPLGAGDRAGEAVAYVNGAPAGSIELVYKQGAERPEVPERRETALWRRLMGLGERILVTLS